MFFESPCARDVPEEAQSTTTEVVKVTKGDVSEAQILQRLRELAPGDFQWELIRLEDNNYKVDFPTRGFGASPQLWALQSSWHRVHS